MNNEMISKTQIVDLEEGATPAQLAVSITYAALKALRDGGNLVPGTWYRITDYHCTTTQANTQSAGNVFDIIVMADSSIKLNENARAAHHEGDTYFENCKLEAWELKYCLDNDTDRFAWASNGYLSPVTHQPMMIIDEGGEGYFIYVRYPSLDSSGNFAWVQESGLGQIGGESSEYFEEYINGNSENLSTSDVILTDTETPNIGSSELINEQHQCTIVNISGSGGKGVIYYMKDEWNNECPYDFKSIQFKRWAVTEYEKCPSLVVDSQDNNNGYYYGAMQLNGESQVLENATYGEDFGWFYTFALKDLATENWYDYTVVAHLGLKNDEGGELACYDNHLEPGTDEYSSGKGEMAKMLNNIVFFNCFTDLSDTSNADDYQYCNNNRFLGNCHSNTFGNSCSGNTFGNNCQYNSFGNYCNNNSFGNGCYSNSFGNYCQTITVFDGVQNCSVTGGSDNSPVKNAQILNGTADANANNKLTIGFVANKAYTQVAAKTTAGNLQIFNPADLVQQAELNYAEA